MPDSLPFPYRWLGEETWLLNRHGRARRQDRQGRRSGRADPQEIRGRHQRPVPGPVGSSSASSTNQFIRRRMPITRPRAGVPPEGVRQRRHLFRLSTAGITAGAASVSTPKRNWINGLCPQHLPQAGDSFSEKNYFFRMSKVPAVACRGISREKSDFIRPERYRNEVLSIDSGKRARWKTGAFRVRKPPRMGDRDAVRQGLRRVSVVGRAAQTIFPPSAGPTATSMPRTGPASTSCQGQFRSRTGCSAHHG